MHREQPANTSIGITINTGIANIIYPEEDNVYNFTINFPEEIEAIFDIQQITTYDKIYEGNITIEFKETKYGFKLSQRWHNSYDPLNTNDGLTFFYGMQARPPAGRGGQTYEEYVYKIFTIDQVIQPSRTIKIKKGDEVLKTFSGSELYVNFSTTLIKEQTLKLSSDDIDTLSYNQMLNLNTNNYFGKRYSNNFLFMKLMKITTKRFKEIFFCNLLFSRHQVPMRYLQVKAI